jgi:hypothetical protein
MKRLVIAGLAAVTLAAPFAGAAQAQHRGYIQAPPYWDPIERRIAQLDQRIERGLYRGHLTRREAYFLRRDLQGLIQLERQYQYSGYGLSYRERADLDYRFNALAQRVRFERRDPERRRDRDRDDRHDRYDDNRYGDDGRYDDGRRY